MRASNTPCHPLFGDGGDASLVPGAGTAFASASDEIDPFEDVMAIAADAAAVVFAFGNGDAPTLGGVAKATLAADDFLFARRERRRTPRNGLSRPAA